MTAADAPQVEPLKLTLEEARRRHDAASAELQRLCEGKRFHMSIPARPDDSDVILGDALQALKALTEGHDLAAELVEALEAWRAWAAKHQADLYRGDLPVPGYVALCRLMVDSDFVLARVRSGER